MKKLIFMAALVLAGCGESEAEKAEKEYDIVASEAIDDGAKCAAARKVEAAYLAEGNAERYDHWNLIASVDCM